MNGLDEIGLTLERGDAIASYEGEMTQGRPWIEGRARLGQTLS